ncbi:hypothetical protein [Streptomyces sp. NPDC001658]
MTDFRITWRVVVAMICGTISGTLLAIAIGQTVFFDTPMLALGAGLSGLMTAGAGLLVVHSTGSPDRPG